VAKAVGAANGWVAAVILCSPGNPRGEILPAGTLREIAEIAASVGALLIVDECYTDLTLGQPPVGYLSLVEAGSVEPAEFVVLHSLSKRSGAPGLRSGFVAGTPSTVAAYAEYNRACGVSPPLPVDAVAAALWADDDHVAAARDSLRRNWDLADAALGGVAHYARPEAGFFLWLRVPDDEETALRLWRDHALSVMPGRYLAAEGVDGTNPGADHLRIALVHGEARMREGLGRLRDALTASAAVR
jgi:aspartate/methionine/tyrosine aminotransferase